MIKDYASKIGATGKVKCVNNDLKVESVENVDSKIKVLADNNISTIIAPHKSQTGILQWKNSKVYYISSLKEAVPYLLYEEILQKMQWIPLPLIDKVIKGKEEFRGWGQHKIFQEIPLSLKKFKFKKEENKEDEEEVIERWSISDFFNHLHEDDGVKIYIVTGDAGIGKSTLLYALEASLAYEYYTQGKGLYPVRVPLNRIKDKDLEDAWIDELLNGVRSEDIRELADRFKSEDGDNDLVKNLRGGVLRSEIPKVIMLDGMDEVDVEDIDSGVKEARRVEGVSKIVVAGRGYEVVMEKVRGILEDLGYDEGEVRLIELEGLDEGQAKRLLGVIINNQDKVESLVGRIRGSGGMWLMRYPLMVVGIGLIERRLRDVVMEEGRIYEEWLRWSLEEGFKEVGVEVDKDILEILEVVIGYWLYRVMRRRLEWKRGFDIGEIEEWDFRESVMRGVNGVYKSLELRSGEFEEFVSRVGGLGNLWKIVRKSLRDRGIWTIMGDSIWFNHIGFLEMLVGIGIGEMVDIAEEWEDVEGELELLTSAHFCRELRFSLWWWKRQGKMELVKSYMKLAWECVYGTTFRESGYWSREELEAVGLGCKDIGEIRLWTEAEVYRECVKKLDSKDFIDFCWGAIDYWFDDIITEKLMEILKDGRIRKSTLDILTSLIDRGLFKQDISTTILPLLKDKDGRIRESALKTLRSLVKKNLLKEDISNYVLPLLKDNYGIGLLREFVLDILTSLIDRGLFKQDISTTILPLLKDENPYVRRPASELLTSFIEKNLSKQDISSFILPLLKDRDWRVRDSALNILTSLIEKNLLKDISNSILPLLKDEERLVRYSALGLLKSLTEKGLLQKDISNSILPLLKDEDSLVREAARSLLEFLIEKGLLKHDISNYILPLTGDKYWEVRENAFYLLISLIEKRLLKHDISNYILPLINYNYWRVKKSVLNLLKSLVDEGLLKIDISNHILPLLRDKDWRIRSSTLDLLMSLIEKRLLKQDVSNYVLPLLKDEVGAVNWRARKLLRHFGSKTLIPLIPPQWVSTKILENVFTCNSYNEIPKSLRYHMRIYLYNPIDSNITYQSLNTIEKNYNIEIHYNYLKLFKNQKEPFETVTHKHKESPDNYTTPKQREEVKNICGHIPLLDTITPLLGLWNEVNFWDEDDVSDELISVFNKIEEIKGLGSLNFDSIAKEMISSVKEKVIKWGNEKIDDKLAELIGLQLIDAPSQDMLGINMDFVIRISGAVVINGVGKRAIYEARVKRVLAGNDILVLPSMNEVNKVKGLVSVAMTNMREDFIDEIIRGFVYGWRWGGGRGSYVVYLRVYREPDIEMIEGRSAGLAFALLGFLSALNLTQNAILQNKQDSGR